jgi:hypothetical protein
MLRPPAVRTFADRGLNEFPAIVITNLTTYEELKGTQKARRIGAKRRWIAEGDPEGKRSAVNTVLADVMS